MKPGSAARPDPRTGEGERLAHRARDPGADARPAATAPKGPARGELLVRLIDHHDATRDFIHRFDDIEPERRAGRVVRRAEQHDIGIDGPHLGGRLFRRDGVVGLASAGDPAGAGPLRDQRIHRVRRCEPEGGASRTSEGLQDALQHLVDPLPAQMPSASRPCPRYSAKPSRRAVNSRSG